MILEAVRVARSGTAIEIHFSGGKQRLVRWTDLARSLGDPDPRMSRFLAAEVSGDAVRVTLAGGASETLQLSDIVGPGQRSVDLVVETRGPLMTCDHGVEGNALGMLKGGAVLIGGGRIRWVGAHTDVHRSGFDLANAKRIDVGERLVSPGLIDCHAHPIFAGNRANEFALRSAGKGYLDIAAAGGGIAATVKATRAASTGQLIDLSCQRLRRALACGTTTIEAKSGYALTTEGEMRMLEVGQAVDSLQPVDVETTLLGAHALPPERANDRDQYVRECATDMVSAAVSAKLCRAIDVYCDEGAFTLDESRQILSAGKDAGLLVRGHVGQFADLGCAQLVAELGGTSVDHVEQISAAGIAGLAAHSVTAVMLPGACVQLRMAPPPVAALREAGVRLAVATDMNPGSSMGETLPVQMWLAATHLGMTVEEAWLGVTRYAARVLGRTDIGALMPGAIADLVIWDAVHPAEIPYRYDRGPTLVAQVIKSGRPAS